MTVFNIVFVAVAMPFLYTRLKKGGISKEIMKDIRKRYLEFVLIFVVLSLPISLLLKPYYKFNE